MIVRILRGWQRHRAAVREAERLVVTHDELGIERARAFATEPALAEERRKHFARVVRVVEKRKALLRGVDTGTRYDLMNQWRARSGLSD